VVFVLAVFAIVFAVLAYQRKAYSRHHPVFSGALTPTATHRSNTPSNFYDTAHSQTPGFSSQNVGKTSSELQYTSMPSSLVLDTAPPHLSQSTPVDGAGASSQISHDRLSSRTLEGNKSPQRGSVLLSDRGHSITGGSRTNSGQDSGSGAAGIRGIKDTVHNAVVEMQGDLHEQQLQIFDVLGKGGFGTVYHGALLGRLDIS
jgi:hypothetical protein